VREVFGQGNDFAAKITYSVKDPKGLLQAFRTSVSLRVVVTVDMIATGTDVKPLECVFFLGDVRSAAYFEQMKGRGARTVEAADYQAVTPDAKVKERDGSVHGVELVARDKADLDVTWLRDESLEDLDNLPAPETGDHRPRDRRGPHRSPPAISPALQQVISQFARRASPPA
jgi:type I restriction enzyme R subunit